MQIVAHMPSIPFYKLLKKLCRSWYIYISKENGIDFMLQKKALTKLQAILLLDIILVTAAASGFFYVQSLPGSTLSDFDVQFIDLQTNPSQVLLGQDTQVSINITNKGPEKGTYNVNLMLDGEPNQSNITSLASGETKRIAFTVSNAGEGLHIVKIGNLETTFNVISLFSFTDLAINRTEAKIGEPLGITVKVTNRANETAEYSLTLTIDNAATQTKTGQLAGGESANVLFEVVEQAEGTYQFKVANLNGTFSITPSAPPPKPAEFIVANLTIDPDVAELGADVNVTAKVTNVGELSGSYTVEFSVNGETKGSESVQLSGGETRTVAFTISESAKGNYTIVVGNLTGILSVQGPSQIKLTNLIVRPYEVWAGETVTVIARGTNQGAETSSLSLRLKVDGELVQTKTLTAAAGAEGSVEFTLEAPALAGGDSLTHIVDVNGMQGGFMVVKNGYHTLNVEITPRGDAEFDITYTDGHTEKHVTFWTALLPEGTYTVTMPNQDPTGRVTFLQWDDGSTSLARTFTLTARRTVTATYTGGTSCPSLYIWNGTDYVYVADVSNHGWLGYINYINSDSSITYYRNHPWDYVPIDRGQLQPTNGNLNLTLTQRWNEIFYLDQAYLAVVDHPANVSVYSTMVEQYLDPNYMGKIYTINQNPQGLVSAVNEKGENVLSQISRVDNAFTNGTNGIQSPAWDNITWNRLTLNLGDLKDASQIKLVVRAVVDWGSGEDYVTWLDKFFAQPVPDGTEVTPPPYMEVRDVNGNWVRVPQSRDFPLPPDSVARTYIIDLTGLFLTNDYSLRINNFWNVTFDYIGVDVTPQQEITIQRINPQAYLYEAFPAGSAAATGNFTRYGNVTQLVIAEDDMFVIGRQGDSVSLQFPIANLAPPAEGMVRDYFLFESCWFKDENGNWGFGFGFTVDPLPFTSMTGFPYPPNESYPDDAAHQNYLQEWNTRLISLPTAPLDPAYNPPPSRNLPS